MPTCKTPTVPGQYRCLVKVKDEFRVEFRDIWLFPGEGHWMFSNIEIIKVYYPAKEVYTPIRHIDDDQAVILLSAIMMQAVKDVKMGSEPDRKTALWFLQGSSAGDYLLRTLDEIPQQINHSVSDVRMKRGVKHHG